MEGTIILFISQLHVDGLAPVAALRYEQIRRGLGDPGIRKMPRVEYVVKGVKPGAQRRRLPITPEVLAKLQEVWDRCGTQRY